jgi:hypothetical protein
VTIRWLTDADRAEMARVQRKCVERGELLSAYWRWFAERAGHPEGPIYVPDLPPETQERLLRLLRADDGRGEAGRGQQDS